jgi:hypothetical protein
MSRSLLLVSCLVIGLLVLACSKQETNRNETNRNAAATTAAPASASPVATVNASAEIGVPECDKFINEYEACVTTKVPEQARAQFTAAVKTWRTEWKKLAANPTTKPGLVTACKTQLETARTQMKAYNCTF